MRTVAETARRRRAPAIVMHNDGVLLCRVEIDGQTIKSRDTITPWRLEAPCLHLADVKRRFDLCIGGSHKRNLGFACRRCDIIYLVGHIRRRAMHHDIATLVGNTHSTYHLKRLAHHRRAQGLGVEAIQTYTVPVLCGVI